MKRDSSRGAIALATRAESEVRRIAVIGAGPMGRLHARAVSRRAEAVGDCVLEAVVDRHGARSERVAGEFGGRALTALAALCGADAVARVDAAIVAVSTWEHAGASETLIDAGLDLLIEKPMTGTAAGAARLARHAANAGRILAVGHTEWWNPVWPRLLAACGTPRRATFQRRHPPTERGLDIDVVQDFMIHDLDWVRRRFAGEIVSLEAEGRAVRNERVDEARVEITFDDGATACLEASRVHADRSRVVEIEGTVGRGTGDLLTGEISLEKGEATHAAPEASGPLQEPLDRQLEDLLDACVARKPPANDAGHGVATLEWVDRIRARIHGEPA